MHMPENPSEPDHSSYSEYDKNAGGKVESMPPITDPNQAARQAIDQFKKDHPKAIRTDMPPTPGPTVEAAQFIARHGKEETQPIVGAETVEVDDLPTDQNTVVNPTLQDKPSNS